MSKEQRLELMRRRLAKEINFEDLASDLAFEIVIMCKFFGWELDYTLNLAIWRFNKICDNIKRYYDELNNGNSNNIINTIG